MTHQWRGWISRLIVFALLVGGFFGVAFAIPDVLIRFARVLPENYAQNAAELMRKGDYAAAQRVCERRIEQFSYDFSAHYLLAEALARQKNYNDAAHTIKTIGAKLPAARANRGATLGYDEPRTYQLLAQYLWADGKFQEAGEMARAAWDAGAPVLEIFQGEAHLQDLKTKAAAAGTMGIKIRDDQLFARATSALKDLGTTEAKVSAALLYAEWSQHADGVGTSTEQMLQDAINFAPGMQGARLALAYYFEREGVADAATSLTQEVHASIGSRVLNAQDFKTGAGASATTRTLSMGRNGKAEIQLNTGVYRMTNLLFGAAGSNALALYPVVIIRSGAQELTRIYVDSKTPRVYDLPLWPKGVPKNLRLTFEFSNDEYDPFTRADRNVLFSDIMLY